MVGVRMAYHVMSMWKGLLIWFMNLNRTACYNVCGLSFDKKNSKSKSNGYYPKDDNGYVNGGYTGTRNGEVYHNDGSGRIPAVDIRKLYKSYKVRGKDVNVLEGITLSVPQGAIYGLLGPSGCGKTTLLRSIIGRLDYSGGSIRVFGEEPGTPGTEVPGSRVGYMPQEIALFGEFTAEETLMYFGRIFQMRMADVDRRTKFLLEFLHLPRDGRFVKNLSGGQKRRVSFACALLHEPELLILDEPTVGVDPLLRQSIWQHLVTIAQGGDTTIIITTHYIEEARQAHAVGLMRNGRILAENDPETLMSTHNLPTLEDVFLKLCLLDSKADAEPVAPSSVTANAAAILSANNTDLTDVTTQPPRQVQAIPDVKYTGSVKHGNRKEAPKCSSPISYHKCKAMTIKNVLKMVRNPGFMAFQFILPSIQIILFCVAIGHRPKGLSIAVVNSEGNNPDLLNYGQLFLDHVGNVSVTQHFYDHIEDAKQSVLDGKTWSVLHIPGNFSQDFVSRVYACTTAEDDVLLGSTIKIYLDNTNQQISYSIREIVLLAFQKFSKDLMVKSGLNDKLGDLPINFEESLVGNAVPSFTEFMAPGIILSLAYFMAVGLTSLSFVMERKEGLLDRTLVCGVSTFEVLIGHFITQFIVMFVQCGLVLFFTIVVFSNPSEGPAWEVGLLTILQGMCGMAYGFLISAFCDEENSAVMVALGSFYPNLMLSGVIWPIEGMPKFLQYISYCLPQTYAVEGLRALMLRGWNIMYTTVWMAYLTTSLWMLFFTAMAAIIFRIRR